MVYILMSTYNGKLFFAEQINSLLKQKYEKVKVLIRDDGSTDVEFRQLLCDYARNFRDKIQVIFGVNIGACGSFLELLRQVPADCEYVGFSDQDDVWKDIKISRAVEHLSNCDNKMPTLYFSAYTVVDEKLRPIRRYIDISKKAGVKHALFETIACGCTMFINKAAHECINRYHADYNKIVMHDSWVYLVIAAFGKTLYDGDSTILYRQHSSNITGSAGITHGLRILGLLQGMGWGWLLNSGQRLRGGWVGNIAQIEEFFGVYARSMDENLARDLGEFLYIVKYGRLLQRIRYALRSKLFDARGALHNFILRFFIILGDVQGRNDGNKQVQ